MKLSPEIQFHEDIRLLIYRPRGLIDEAAINKVTSVIEELEAETPAPFNRFSDTLEVLLTEGSSIKVRVFHEREEAAQWLGVPVDRLETSSNPRET